MKERLPRPLTVRIDPRELGAALAHMDDDEQGAFFTEFCRELRAVAGTNFNAEMQLHYANSKLSEDDRSLLSCLGMERS